MNVMGYADRRVKAAAAFAAFDEAGVQAEEIAASWKHPDGGRRRCELCRGRHLLRPARSRPHRRRAWQIRARQHREIQRCRRRVVFGRGAQRRTPLARRYPRSRLDERRLRRHDGARVSGRGAIQVAPLPDPETVGGIALSSHRDNGSECCQPGLATFVGYTRRRTRNGGTASIMTSLRSALRAAYAGAACRAAAGPAAAQDCSRPRRSRPSWSMPRPARCCFPRTPTS